MTSLAAPQARTPSEGSDRSEWFAPVEGIIAAMNMAAGIALIAGGAVVGALTAFGLWRRVPPTVGPLLAAASGAAVGAGAILVQDRAAPGDWVIAVGALTMLTPVHLRVLFGRPGAREGG